MRFQVDMMTSNFRAHSKPLLNSRRLVQRFISQIFASFGTLHREIYIVGYHFIPYSFPTISKNIMDTEIIYIYIYCYVCIIFIDIFFFDGTPSSRFNGKHCHQLHWKPSHHTPGVGAPLYRAAFGKTPQ